MDGLDDLDDDPELSQTLVEQEECEASCAPYLALDPAALPAAQLERMRAAGLVDDGARVRLMREKHVA